MTTLAQIQSIGDLDSRVINAGALLEAELRSKYSEAAEAGLGELAQMEPLFRNDAFIRDVNFAIGIRNGIAHINDGNRPRDDEKERSAKYMIKAIRMVRGENPNGLDDADRFDASETDAALKRIFRSRRKKCFLWAALIFVITINAAFIFLPEWQLSIMIFGVIYTIGTVYYGLRRHLFHSHYYELPGSKFKSGDHRCIHCGHRGRNGRGIYTHGEYRSNRKFHECSKCGELLFVS